MFQGLINALPGGISQGLMWAILALGVYVTYKILDFADLTVDGSLATGGCVAIVLTAAKIHPIIAIIVAFFAARSKTLMLFEIIISARNDPKREVILSLNFSERYVVV